MSFMWNKSSTQMEDGDLFYIRHFDSVKILREGESSSSAPLVVLRVNTAKQKSFAYIQVVAFRSATYISKLTFLTFFVFKGRVKQMIFLNDALNIERICYFNKIRQIVPNSRCCYTKSTKCNFSLYKVRYYQ